MPDDRHSFTACSIAAILLLAVTLQLQGCGDEPPPPPAPPVQPPPPPVADRVNDLIELLRDQETLKSARTELLEIGTEATPTYFERMQDENSVIRWELASLQGEIHDQRALLPLVLCVLHDTDVAVRERAMWALSRFPRHAAATAQLENALESADETTRWRAAVALVRLRVSSGVSIVNEGLADPARRGEALGVLGQISDESTAPAITAAFGDYDVIERQRAVMVLATCEGEAAVDALIAALGDEAVEVRWRACFALAQTGDDRAVESLEALQGRETDPMVLKHAKKALLKLRR